MTYITKAIEFPKGTHAREDVLDRRILLIGSYLKPNSGEKLGAMATGKQQSSFLLLPFCGQLPSSHSHLEASQNRVHKASIAAFSRSSRPRSIALPVTWSGGNHSVPMVALRSALRMNLRVNRERFRGTASAVQAGTSSSTSGPASTCQFAEFRSALMPPFERFSQPYDSHVPQIIRNVAAAFSGESWTWLQTNSRTERRNRSTHDSSACQL